MSTHAHETEKTPQKFAHRTRYFLFRGHLYSYLRSTNGIENSHREFNYTQPVRIPVRQSAMIIGREIEIRRCSPDKLGNLFFDTLTPRANSIYIVNLHVEICVDAWPKQSVRKYDIAHTGSTSECVRYIVKIKIQPIAFFVHIGTGKRTYVCVRCKVPIFTTLLLVIHLVIILDVRT